MESSCSVIQKPRNTAVRVNNTEGGGGRSTAATLPEAAKSPRPPPTPGSPPAGRGVTPVGFLRRRRSSHADNC